MLLDFLMNLFKCEAFVVNFFFYHLNRYIRRGGYGKLVQKEIEAQRQLVDYGAGSLGSFQTAVPSHYGTHGGGHGHGSSHRHNRDYHRKRHREDDRSAPELSKRNSDYESRRTSDNESRPEKNPRFRESGDSDEEEDDDRRGMRS
eukprot:TRINITY_DN4064_c0_g1_i1.p1 TRINITY_DN4064_c0_g1~~TRINITY_DN4064_c0_g1_i1.p1  ORF type:complete len:145 (+),score=20.11 TRINITY_DN4064_c0_g1_i1:97-531(+)